MSTLPDIILNDLAVSVQGVLDCGSDVNAGGSLNVGKAVSVQGVLDCGSDVNAWGSLNVGKDPNKPANHALSVSQVGDVTAIASLSVRGMITTQASLVVGGIMTAKTGQR